jgi:hypothetical protein
LPKHRRGSRDRGPAEGLGILATVIACGPLVGCAVWIAA